MKRKIEEERRKLEENMKRKRIPKPKPEAKPVEVKDTKKEQMKLRVIKLWHNVKIIYWRGMLLKVFWRDYTDRIMMRREGILAEHLKLQQILLEGSQKLMILLAQKGMKNYIDNQKKKPIMCIIEPAKLKLYSAKQTTNKKKLIERAVNAANFAKFLIDSMTVALQDPKLDVTVLKMMGKMFVDGYCLQNNFHFQSELDRVQMTCFGILKEQENHPERVRMLCTNYLVFQILIPFVIKMPWKYLKNVHFPPNASFRLNLRILCSIIYWVFYDWVIAQTPKIKNSQKNVRPRFRVVPTKAKSIIDETAGPDFTKKPEYAEELFILDVFTKEDLSEVFHDQELVLPLLQSVSDFVFALTEISFESQRNLKEKAKMLRQEMKKKRRNEVINHLVKLNILNHFHEKDLSKDHFGISSYQNLSAIPESPSQIAESPSQVPKSPSQVLESPVQILENTSQVPESRSQVPESPSQLPESSSQMPKSPTPENSPQMPKTPSQVPENVPQTPENSSQKPDNPSLPQ